MKWTYNKFRALLCRHGAPFAIVTPDGSKALPGEQAIELLRDLNANEPPAAVVDTGDLVGVLGRTNGWRTRQAISNLLRDMEECVGAARCCEERKDWLEMLRHLNDGLAASEKLRAITNVRQNIISAEKL